VKRSGFGGWSVRRGRLVRYAGAGPALSKGVAAGKTLEYTHGKPGKHFDPNVAELFLESDMEPIRRHTMSTRIS